MWPVVCEQTNCEAYLKTGKKEKTLASKFKFTFVDLLCDFSILFIYCFNTGIKKKIVPKYHDLLYKIQQLFLIKINKS